MVTTSEVKAWEAGVTASRTPRTKTDITDQMTREKEKHLKKKCLKCTEHYDHESFTVNYIKDPNGKVISVLRGNICRDCMKRRTDSTIGVEESLSLNNIDRRLREADTDIDALRREFEDYRIEASENQRKLSDMIKNLSDKLGYFIDSNCNAVKKMDHSF